MKEPAERSASLVFASWIGALALLFVALPAWRTAVWGLIGFSSVAAVIAGVRRYRPRRRLPWYLMAAGLAAGAIGDTVLTGLDRALRPESSPAFPSVVDIGYLSALLLMTAGLFGLARSGSRSPDRARLLDSLVLTGGLALLSWIYLASPSIGNPDLTPLGRAVAIAYPLGDVLVLATVARLVSVARHSVAVALLALGGTALLAADVLVGLSVLHGPWNVGWLVALGWLGLYTTWGAAALHPSMVELTDPHLADEEVTTWRVVVLAVSSLIAPAVLIVEAVGGGVRHASAIAFLSGLMFLLVLARLASVVRTHRGALKRERGLRLAGAALVSATDSGQVAAALREAVAHLLPAGEPHRVVLVVHEPVPEQTPRTGARLVSTETLAGSPGWDHASLAGYEVTLACPLTLADRPSGDPNVGLLVIAADEHRLAALRVPVEVLAAQAALALERIALTAEINRRDSEAYFRTLVHHTSDVIFIVHSDNRIRYASPSARAVLGREDFAGVPLPDLVPPGDRGRAGKLLARVRAGEVRDEPADWTVIGADGEHLEVEVALRDLSTDPTVSGLVVTFRDVTERRRLERELTHRAFHDSLTGLANRVLFQERVQRAVSRARGRAGMVGVLFIDLDDFKVVNDTLGHETGDRLLRAVGQRLTAELRPRDIAARLGGDEFAALIEDAHDPAEIEAVAQRLVTALEAPFALGDLLVNGAASIGVATSAEAADGPELLRQADLALYVAKGAGKGSWRRYQPTLHAAVVQRLELRSQLERAVADGAFTLQYQPIVALHSGATEGLEALIRWRHPVRGLVGPAEFIELAEETGLIVPIGNWVLAHAIETARDWDGPFVSVNVSVRQFRMPGFVTRVRAQLAAAALRPDRLLLEITESLLLRDDEQVWADLAELRRIGVRIAIDDFGTGYSSLSYLRQMPVDVLKIDRSFTDTVGTSAQQRALVDGIVRLAHTLGLQVVAEGIETRTDRDLLAAIGCRYGQGYFFARPMTRTAAEQWLEEYPRRVSGVPA